MPGPAVKNTASAPMIYFDNAPALGVLNGVVEIELVARTMMQNTDGVIAQEIICVGHLRCSLQAASNLRTAIDKAMAIAQGQAPQADVEDADPVASALEQKLARMKTLS